jgi:hypothetical protein
MVVDGKWRVMDERWLVWGRAGSRISLTIFIMRAARFTRLTQKSLDSKRAGVNRYRRSTAIRHKI